MRPHLKYGQNANGSVFETFGFHQKETQCVHVSACKNSALWVEEITCGAIDSTLLVYVSRHQLQDLQKTSVTVSKFLLKFTSGVLRAATI